VRRVVAIIISGRKGQLKKRSVDSFWEEMKCVSNADGMAPRLLIWGVTIGPFFEKKVKRNGQGYEVSKSHGTGREKNVSV